MYIFTYTKTINETGQKIQFAHRCLTLGVLQLALSEYQDIDERLYSKSGLKVIEVAV